MIINHNLSSINTNRVMRHKEVEITSDMSRLSSGMRINRAADDASGLAVSEKMRSQIRGLNKAEKNAQDGISFIQTAEGYLGETTAIVQRLRELAIQASNGVYTSEDRLQIQIEVSQLVDEIDRIASHAEFNGLKMLTGRYATAAGANVPTASMWFHVGANMDQRIQVNIMTMTIKGLSLEVNGNPLSVSSPTKANQAIGILDDALFKINKQRSDLGAYQNRLGHVIKSVSIGAENLQASESRIRDANMAEEMSNLIKNQVLFQAQTSMLAQANMKTQSVLQILS